MNLTKLTAIDSTNDEAKRLIKSGAAVDWHVLSADTQTAGHGRYGRDWQSPLGNLYMSVTLKNIWGLQKAAQISFVAAVALGEVIDSPQVQYKWPNDVLIGGKKVAGILIESLDNWLVVGVGVNISEAPKNVNNPATSLAESADIGLSCGEFLEKFIYVFENQLNFWQKAGFSYIRDAWLKKAYKINEEITVNLGNETFVGVFEGLTADGELRIRCGNGVRTVGSGEVFF